jgi:hypothetical protein
MKAAAVYALLLWLCCAAFADEWQTIRNCRLMTDPSEPRFAADETFGVFEAAGFRWPWRNTPLAERVTHPASEGFPDACFDGFVVKGDMRVVSCEVLLIDGVSDHRPVKLVLE